MLSVVEVSNGLLGVPVGITTRLANVGTEFGVQLSGSSQSADSEPSQVRSAELYVQVIKPLLSSSLLSPLKEPTAMHTIWICRIT